MKLAVIVVNFNDEDETLKYVKKITEYKIIDRIVVVDNNSTNVDCREKLLTLKSQKVYVIFSDKNGGYSYGNNFGIKYLKEKGEEYDYYAISNPDIIISEASIKRTIDFLNNSLKAVLASPKMLNSSGDRIRRSAWKYRTFARDLVYSSRILELLFYKVLKNGEYTDKEFEEKELCVDCISGAFFIIKRKFYEKIGKFDENVFLFYEEDILAMQVKERGYLTYSLNDVSFMHYESQTIGKTLNYYKKVQELYLSKMYYHKTYTKISKMQEFVFKVFRIIRLLELLIEIPIRKILKK